MKRALLLLLFFLACCASCKKTAMQEMDYGVFNNRGQDTLIITYSDAHFKQRTVTTTDSTWTADIITFDGGTAVLAVKSVHGAQFKAQIWDNGQLLSQHVGSSVSLSAQVP